MDISKIEITEDYKDIIGSLESGTPVIFVSGKAGTGKSTLIQYLKQTLKKRFAVVAPTGVAALNVEGSTIHSFFRLPPRVVQAEDIKRVYDRLYQKLEVLIIDEVSMVRADQMDAINLFLKMNGPDETKPFGGVQLILVGDLYQLPPVVSSTEQPLFAKYLTPFFFSAKAMEAVGCHHVELNKIYRQKDSGFTDILNNLRVGEHIAESISVVNTSCFKPQQEDDLCLTLTATNVIADGINTMELGKLDGKLYTFEGQINGNFNLKDDKLPAPMMLKLKLGAKVMFTKNDEEGRWVNGSMGIVKSLDEKKIEVELLPSGNIYRVEKVEWGTFKYETDGDRITPRRSGSYVQYPLMLAWAVTVHKAQGKTLEKIFIDLGTGAFAPGQVYVALSRVRAIEDITLKRPVRVAEVRSDARVKTFFSQLKEKAESSIL